MYLDKNSVRSSLLVIGTVVALAGAVGFVLPMLSSSPPAGAGAIVEGWSPPAPTGTATATVDPSPAAPSSPSASMSASSGSKVAFVALETATPKATALATRLPSSVISPPQPARLQVEVDEVAVNLPQTLLAAPAVIEVPDWEEQKGVRTTAAAEVTSFETVSTHQPVTLPVPVPPARVPDAAPGVVAASTKQTTEIVEPLAATDSGPRTGAAYVQATAAPSPTSMPPAQSLSTSQFAAPQLVNPRADARLSGMVTFEWSPVMELSHGLAYEIVMWSPGQDPGQARGIAPATTMTSQQVNLDPLFGGGQFRTGHLYWTVIVVQQAPYLRMTAPGAGEARYLVRRTDG